MAVVDCSLSVRSDWSSRLEDSVLEVSGTAGSGDGVVVWELSTSYPRVFAAAYRFEIDAAAVNRGLEEGRGRTLVAREVGEEGDQMPLALLNWRLSPEPHEPLRVMAASPRLESQVSAHRQIVIDTGFQLLVDVLLHVADEHRRVALERLGPAAPERARAEERLGAILFDVERDPALLAYLGGLYGERLSVYEATGGAPTLLRLAP